MPATTTITDKHANANSVPSNVERHPLVIPEARMMVSASVASTALATVTVINRIIVL